MRRTQFENARSFVQYFNLHGVSGVSATYRRLLRREVVDICMLIFIADVVTGVQIPLFPLYTISLGASLGLLGVITAVLGLTRLASALPIGMLSDRLDRKTAYGLYGLLLAAAAVGMAIAPRTEWMYIVFTTAYSFISGLCYAAYSAVVLEAIGLGAAATKYSLFSSLSNMPIAYMTLIDGWAHTRWGAGGLLNTEAAIGVAGIIAFIAVAIRWRKV